MFLYIIIILVKATDYGRFSGNYLGRNNKLLKRPILLLDHVHSWTHIIVTFFVIDIYSKLHMSIANG